MILIIFENRERTLILNLVKLLFVLFYILVHGGTTDNNPENYLLIGMRGKRKRTSRSERFHVISKSKREIY